MSAQTVGRRLRRSWWALRFRREIRRLRPSPGFVWCEGQGEVPYSTDKWRYLPVARELHRPVQCPACGIWLTTTEATVPRHEIPADQPLMLSWRDGRVG